MYGFKLLLIIATYVTHHLEAVQTKLRRGQLCHLRRELTQFGPT